LLFLGTIGFIYNHEEAVALENLHVETKQIKDDIQLQIHSDKENLSTIASFAEKLYADGKDINTVFHAFESIGLIEKLVILLPDNTLISRKGEFLPDIQIDFEQELKKGEYTSGRVLSFTPPARNIVRNAVHITHDGEVIGILYGIIELDKLQGRYSEMVDELNAQLYIYENGNGTFIVDSFRNQSLDNINDLKNYTYKKVGARNALAISRVSFAGIIQMDGERIGHIAVAFGAIGDMVIRYRELEKMLEGKTVSEAKALKEEFLAAYEETIRPIKGRVSADYRKMVCMNLLREFLEEKGM
jgi:hypothetical protein